MQGKTNYIYYLCSTIIKHTTMMILLTFTAICAYFFRALTIIAMFCLIIYFIAVNVQFIKENLDNRQ